MPLMGGSPFWAKSPPGQALCRHRGGEANSESVLLSIIEGRPRQTPSRASPCPSLLGALGSPSAVSAPPEGGGGLPSGGVHWRLSVMLGLRHLPSGLASSPGQKLRRETTGSLDPHSASAPWAARGLPAAQRVPFGCKGREGASFRAPPGSFLRPSARWRTSFRVLCGQPVGLSRLDSQLGSPLAAKALGGVWAPAAATSSSEQRGEARPTGGQRGDRFESRAGLP